MARKYAGAAWLHQATNQTPQTRPSHERRHALTAVFLVRNPETGDIEKGHFPYEGPVSVKVWEQYAKKFLKLNASGYFWPNDPLEAYQQGVGEIIRAAERIHCGEVTLKTASPVTYLANTGALALLNFHRRKVRPARRMYRDIQKKTDGVGARGEDHYDVDNIDIYELTPSHECRTSFGGECAQTFDTPEMTALELGELLPGVPSGATRRRLARQILETLFEHLPEEAVRAFRGYLAADGNFVEAARLAGISKSKFYRQWPRWIKLAKEIGEKSGFSGH